MIVLEYLAFGISIVGVAIITWGLLKGLVEYLAFEFKCSKKPGAGSITAIRINVGQYLLLGLEFLIGADIILTVIEPGLEEIAVLAAIVIIRTIISYFLNKEVENL